MTTSTVPLSGKPSRRAEVASPYSAFIIRVHRGKALKASQTETPERRPHAAYRTFPPCIIITITTSTISSRSSSSIARASAAGEPDLDDLDLSFPAVLLHPLLCDLDEAWREVHHHHLQRHHQTTMNASPLSSHARDFYCTLLVAAAPKGALPPWVSSPCMAHGTLGDQSEPLIVPWRRCPCIRGSTPRLILCRLPCRPRRHP